MPKSTQYCGVNPYKPYALQIFWGEGNKPGGVKKILNHNSWHVPCVLPFLFPANRYYPCQLFHFDQGTNAEIQCRRGHIDLGDRGKHLPGVDGNSACGGVEHGAKLGFFVSLWDDYLFQLKKTALLKTGSAIKYLDGKCMEMECHMLSLPVQGAQRSSSLAVHKSPTL